MLKSLTRVVPLLLFIFFAIQAASEASTDIDSAQTANTGTGTIQDTSIQFASPDSVEKSVLEDSIATRAPSTVVIITSKPIGAAVLWNDSVVGVTPVTVPGVVPGNYNLILKMKSYYLKRVEVAIASKDTQSIHFDLLKPSSVYFTSKPTGALIILNGKEKGVAPLLDSLMKPGQYSVRATLENHDPVEKSVTVGNGVVDTVLFELVASNTKKDSVTISSLKPTSKLRKYSGLIGAIAFGVFAIILLIGESSDL